MRKRHALALAAGIALGSAGRAQADNPSPVAPSPHLQAAQRLYQKLDLEAALAELREAEQDAKGNEDETVQIMIYKGLIYAETGRSPEMADFFKRALAMRPWVEVPPDTSPRLAKLFNDSRKELWGSGGQIKPPPKKRQRAASTGTGAAPPVGGTSPPPAPSTSPATPSDGAAAAPADRAPADKPAAADQVAPAEKPPPAPASTSGLEPPK